MGIRTAAAGAVFVIVGTAAHVAYAGEEPSRHGATIATAARGGTADSDGHSRQHPYNNAILKIDANPARPTFGTVVAAYTGTSEHAGLDAVVGYPNNSACGALPDDDTGLDLRRGPGGAAMDAVTAAVDDGAIHVGATPDVLFGLEQDTGDLRWASTSGLDLFAYQPITVANGVLYTITDAGVLAVFDAGDGTPILQRNIATDGAYDHCLGVGSGVAVARNTVYVPCDAGGPHDLAGLPGPPGGLVAYRMG